MSKVIQYHALVRADCSSFITAPLDIHPRELYFILCRSQNESFPFDPNLALDRGNQESSIPVTKWEFRTAAVMSAAKHSLEAEAAAAENLQDSIVPGHSGGILT